MFPNNIFLGRGEGVVFVEHMFITMDAWNSRKQSTSCQLFEEGWLLTQLKYEGRSLLCENAEEG